MEEGGVRRWWKNCCGKECKKSRNARMGFDEERKVDGMSEEWERVEQNGVKW